MAIKVSFQNSGGELSSETAATHQEAMIVAVRMLTDAGELYDGDKLIITGEKD